MLIVKNKQNNTLANHLFTLLIGFYKKMIFVQHSVFQRKTPDLRARQTQSKQKPPKREKSLPTAVLVRSIGKSCSSFLSSSLENLAAVSRAHSFSEAVLFLSLTNLRLICSKHFYTFFQLIAPGFRRFLGRCGISPPAPILRQLLL